MPLCVIAENNGETKEVDVLVELVQRPLNYCLLLDESTIIEKHDGLEPCNEASKFLNNRLVYRFFWIPVSILVAEVG